MNIDPVKFSADLNKTILALEGLTARGDFQHMINSRDYILGMRDCLGTVQGLANDPVAWPKFVAWLNSLS